jgi:CheY-like chemotaxis protein
MMASSRRNKAVVLIAEDDPDDRLLCQEALTEIGKNIHTVFVNDGEELLEYLLRRGEYRNPESSPSPGIILLDLNMPRMDGRQVLREIKADPFLRKIPIVVLTTSSSEDDINYCYKQGVCGYITKPTYYEDLIKSMNTLSRYWFEIVSLPNIEHVG